MANPADKRFHQLTLAIQKAINSIETPVKEKHVRSTLIGTFQEQSAVTYWMVAVRLPLQDNRIVSWKFCHVTHKLLREGHPACLDDSQRHIGMIENLGKLWVHLREGYGRLIHLYSNLLVTKLKFHARNPRFPGNMQVTADELDSIAENDVNNYFQLCVELFDYMDDILNLQAAVFESLGNARANSMTASGQCRLAALIPCAQDASHVYDCGVRLLFRLHAALPPDTLAGHRERFRQQFKKLSSFYKHASSLQYYRNLLTLPVLPSNPPNFLLQSEFGTYVTPVVSVPEPPPEEPDAVAALVDTSDTVSQATTPDSFDVVDTRATPSPIADPIVERDRLIDHLQNELKRMRSEVSQIIQERNTMLSSMREHCTRVDSQLQATKNTLEEEKQKADILLMQAPEMQKKVSEAEDKARVSDEKFQKLKGAYTQLREEHISLIRQKAEVDKATSSLRAAAAQHESAKAMLQQQLNDRLKDVELLQQSSSSSEEIEAYKSEISNLRSELEQSRQTEVELESLKATLEALEIEHKTASTEKEEKILIVSNELKEAVENLEKYKQQVHEKDSELVKIKDELIGLKQKNGEEYKKAIEEKEAAIKQVTQLTHQYQQEKEENINHTNNLQIELKNLQIKLVDMDETIKLNSNNYEEEMKRKVENFEKALAEKELFIKDALEKLVLIQGELDGVKNSSELILTEKMAKINELQTIIEELHDVNNALNNKHNDFEQQFQTLQSKFELVSNKNDILENSITVMQSKELEYQNIIKELERNNAEIVSKYDNFKDSTSKDINNYLIQLETLTHQINAVNNEKSELLSKLSEATTLMKDQEDQFEICKKESALKLSDMSLQLENSITLNNKSILDLENKLQEKENTVITLESLVLELRGDVSKLIEDKDDMQKNLNEVSSERDVLQNDLLEKDSALQITEARLMHTESERLNAECELQDLLQQNTILEADMAALRIQLEEANAEVKKKTSRLVSCAGELALEVTNEAMSAFENPNSQDANQLASELAVKAFEDLARKSQVEGNEEVVAKSAMLAAHNAAQLSVYVAELSNVSTEADQSEKLNKECRNMLESVKVCLERVCAGTVDRSACMEARGAVASAGRAAAAGAGRTQHSVDDELAFMDRAIEEAARQIEEMLAASRKDDSGVKLEVNEKILDACTTLMAAVKVLVQDARKLQNEIGDPHTRQKMYRKNPQWSEGLISAAKAVVFAAKLLVTSADEAAGESGRVEGVSAAAHEVAGSTAQLVAASRARAPPSAPALARLTAASRAVASAAGAVVAAVRAASALVHDTEALDTSSLSLTATRRLEMESKVRALELESALDAERARLAALRKRHYQLAQLHENGNVTNGE